MKEQKQPDTAIIVGEIKAFMEAHGLTKYRVAKTAGVTASRLNCILGEGVQATKRPALATVKKVIVTVQLLTGVKFVSSQNF